MSKYNIEDDLDLGEKLYCAIQDLEDYNHNLCDKEIDWIICQLQDIKLIYDETIAPKDTTNET